MHSDAVHQVRLTRGCHAGFTRRMTHETTAGCIRSGHAYGDGCHPQWVSDLHSTCPIAAVSPRNIASPDEHTVLHKACPKYLS